MRQDQYERLQALSERLMDRFLVEADPDNWPGKDIPLANMDTQTRGDMYWVKKNGAATGLLYTRVETMIGNTQFGGGTTPAKPSEDDGAEAQLDDEIRRAEKEAARLMANLTGGSKKEFDKRVHRRGRTQTPG